MSKIINKPKVSVIMAFYNVERFIEEAIQSVLNQSFTDFEFIIINDCSPDKSFEIAQKYAKKDSRIILINNEKNLGCAEARNVGLNIAKGEYVAIFDSDDVCMPDRLAVQVDYLEKNPDVFLVGGSFYYINEKGGVIDKVILDINSDSTRLKLPKENCIHNPTVMFRDLNYRYRDKFVPAEDYDLWLRMLTDDKKMVVISNILIKYRIQINSQTNTKRAKQIWGIKKALELYNQRLNNGMDGYDDLIVNNYIFKNENNFKVGLVMAREIKIYFKNSRNMGDVRKKIIKFWQNKYLIIWPASIIFFTISYSPQFIINKFKKLIWK
jgi:glycosyltransferase involved in cell wall biosynthesis